MGRESNAAIFNTGKMGGCAVIFIYFDPDTFFTAQLLPFAAILLAQT